MRKNKWTITDGIWPNKPGGFIFTFAANYRGGGLKPNHVVFTPVDDRTYYGNGHTCRMTHYSAGTGTSLVEKQIYFPACGTDWGGNVH